MNTWYYDGQGFIWSEADEPGKPVTTLKSSADVVTYLNLMEKQLQDREDVLKPLNETIAKLQAENDQLKRRESQYKEQAATLSQSNTQLVLSLADLTKKAAQKSLVDVLPFSLPAGYGAEILLWHVGEQVVGQFHTIDQGHILARVKDTVNGYSGDDKRSCHKDTFSKRKAVARPLDDDRGPSASELEGRDTPGF